MIPISTECRFFDRNLLSEHQAFGKHDQDNTITRCLNLIQILILWQLSVVSMDVEEISVANNHSESAQQMLEEHFDHDLTLILFHLKIGNTFSLIRCSVSDYEKAIVVLRRAEKLYNEWTTVRSVDSEFPTIAKMTDVFLLNSSDSERIQDPDSVIEVEREFTQTVYYLAQVLEKQGDSEMAAKYCTDTLIRQFHSGEYDHIDWSVNAATLSQYYACHNKFLTARRLLAVAQHKLDKVELKDHDDENELLKKRRADSDRILVKYCMMLMDKDDDAEVETELVIGVRSLVEPNATDLEKVIPHDRAVSYETALQIFHFAHKHLSSAVTYFTLNEHASDYADCILDQSMLYQRLILFQSDSGKICKLHKRRVDLLQKLLSELNPVYFLSHVRRISFELGETFSEMVHHKLADTEHAKEEHVIRAAVVKVNSLISKAIQNFGRFIDTFRDKAGRLPVKFEDDDVRAVLIACFATGRLHSKRISSYPNEQLQFWTECEVWYQQIVDYIDTNPGHEEQIRHELKVIREMLPLIPEKKKLILSATMF